jgi:hypothetical protein
VTPPRTALGFRVKSGWATTVLVVGPAREPRVADRRALQLSDPAVPGTRQPYHAVLAAAARNGLAVERRLLGVVRRATRASVRRLLREYRAHGRRPRRAGIVVGSVIDPATIGNDHIRAHALEGRLFRTVLEQALRSEGIACAITVEREAYARAGKVLGRGQAALRRVVSELGDALDGPWRADEKTATLAGWMALR